jgi:hypothetical protein
MGKRTLYSFDEAKGVKVHHRREECRVLRVLRSEELALPVEVVSNLVSKCVIFRLRMTYSNLCSRCSSNLNH